MTNLPVLCDRCGAAIASLDDALVAMQSDELGRAIGLTLDHRTCVAARRQDLETTERTITDLPAADLLRADRATRLRSTARAHWASATRILGKVKRLARIPGGRFRPLLTVGGSSAS